MRFSEIIFLAVAVAVSSANDDGQYRPELYSGDDGLNDDGQYRPELYSGDDGSYHPEYQQQVQLFNGYDPRVQDVQQYQANSGFLNGFDPNQGDTVVINAARHLTSFPPYQRRQGYGSNTYEGQARTIHQNADVGSHGYQYQYQTENGIAAASSGRLEVTPNGRPALRTSGFYEYVGDDGLTYRVDYVADENGYRASGAHLPVQPQNII